MKVLFVCTGVGVFNRGIETFFRDCFDGLRPHLSSRIHLELLKGAGSNVPPDEHRLWCLPRTGRVAALLGAVIHRTPYVTEQLSSVLPLAWRLRVVSPRPDLIFTSDGNLLLALRRLQHLLGATLPPILFSNGGPVNPPFPLPDHVQQVTPEGHKLALSMGEPAGKHSLVPYGLSVPAGEPERLDAEAKRVLRAQLGLPTQPGQPIVVSVGWISRVHKRMDYTVNEVAALPADRRPHLVLLGAMDAASDEVLALARERLGTDGYTARSVTPEAVADYYRAADVFTLASLREGFGRVYLEALVHGLPCVVHEAPTMRYVLGEEGTFADLTRPGALAAALDAMLPVPDRSPAVRARRRESVRARFGWPALAPAYAKMFQTASGKT